MSINLIIDTDISDDCDDCGALAVANHAADLGDCAILAVTVTNTGIASAGAVDAINHYYGRSITLGINNAGTAAIGSVYNSTLYFGYTNAVLAITPSVPSALTTLRTTLHNAADGSVTIASIGGLTNLSVLLNSAADGIDSRTGAALITAKVVNLIVMGGSYPSSSSPEFNFALNPSATNNVVTNWPTTIVFTGYEVGYTVNTGSGLSSTSTYNPVRRAYQLQVGSGNNRSSWDPLAVYYAIYGPGSNFTTVQGQNSANATTGNNTFTAGSGNQYYAVKAVPDATLATLINGYLDAASSVSDPAFTIQTSRTCWNKFDEGFGTTSGDWTGRGHVVSLQNSAGWVSPGQVGSSCLDCSTGATAYASTPDSPDFQFTASQDYTAAIWLKTPASMSGYETVWVKSRISTWFGVYLQGAAVRYSNTAGGFNSPVNLSASAWHHIVIMQIKGNQIMYVDGVLYGAGGATIANGTGPLSFGAWSNSGTITEHTSGQLDDFQFFNTSTNEQNVLAIMNGTLPSTGVKWPGFFGGGELTGGFSDLGMGCT